MAVFKGEYSDSQTKQVLVPAVSGKIIRVRRIVFSAAGAGSCTLLSDPNGAEEQALNAALRVSTQFTVDLLLGRPYGLACQRDKALGWTSVVTGPSTNHSLMVWYDLVD
jgi:hypothetical protein